MDLGLRDRVGIVGGSSRGMGRAVAVALAREGASLTLSARTEPDLRKTEIEIARFSSQQHVFAVKADLSVPDDIKRVVRNTFNRFGRIDVLVNNLAAPPVSRPSEAGDQMWVDTMENNFMSVVRMCREVIPFMKQQQWGRIINVLAAEVKQPDLGSALSTSSRLAVAGYAKSLANELASFNITVNNVIPGLVLTERMSALFREEGMRTGQNEADVLKAATGKIPMRRAGKPEEVGDLITFLASERAGYITGANVQLDGGLVQSTV